MVKVKKRLRLTRRAYICCFFRYPFFFATPPVCRKAPCLLCALSRASLRGDHISVIVGLCGIGGADEDAIDEDMEGGPVVDDADGFITSVYRPGYC